MQVAVVAGLTFRAQMVHPTVVEALAKPKEALGATGLLAQVAAVAVPVQAQAAKAARAS